MDSNNADVYIENLINIFALLVKLEPYLLREIVIGVDKIPN
jgi:hypothetical protein